MSSRSKTTDSERGSYADRCQYIIDNEILATSTRWGRMLRVSGIIICTLLTLFGVVSYIMRTGDLPNPRDTSKLVRRARWSLAEGVGLGGFIIGCAHFAVPYWVAAICVAASGGVCVPVAGAVLATASVIAAAVVVGKSDGSATKRGLEHVVTAMGYTSSFTAHPLIGQVLTNGTSDFSVTVDYVGSITPLTVKRGENINYTFVGFTSPLGKHMSLSSELEIDALIEEIKIAVPGIPNGVPRINGTGLGKRSQEFPVNWHSMSYDQSYADLAQNWINDEGGNGNFDSLSEEKLQRFLSQNRDWKYCFAAEDFKLGEPIDYDHIPGDGGGTGSAFKSQLYFNTYGGIDSYCNDEHVGAENSGDGR